MFTRRVNATWRVVARRQCSTDAATASSSHHVVRKKIVLPKKIPRSPTTLLDALSATVAGDATARHYSFIDDTRLLPQNEKQEMEYTLARLAGRQVARQFAVDWPTLFMYDNDEPRLDAFRPLKLPPLDEQKSTKLQDLHACIAHRRVAHAAQIYTNMRQADIAIDIGTRRQLLQLLCFYNSQDAIIGVDLAANIWYRSMVNIQLEESDAVPVQLEWQSGGVADVLWEELEDKTAADYSVMVAGLAKYHAYGRAFKVYKEMQQKKMVPSVVAYNELLYSLSRDKTQKNTWKICTDLLADMAAHRVLPDAHTFDAAMRALAADSQLPAGKPRELARQLLAECVVVCGTPTLGMLMTMLALYGDDPLAADLVRQTADKLLSSTTPWRPSMAPADDATFFVRALLACGSDLTIADRVLAALDKHPHLITEHSGHTDIYLAYLSLVAHSCYDANELVTRVQEIVPARLAPSAAPDMLRCLRAVQQALVQLNALERVRALAPLYCALARRRMHTFLASLLLEIGIYDTELSTDPTTARAQLLDTVHYIVAQETAQLSRPLLFAYAAFALARLGAPRDEVLALMARIDESVDPAEARLETSADERRKRDTKDFIRRMPARAHNPFVHVNAFLLSLPLAPDTASHSVRLMERCLDMFGTYQHVRTMADSLRESNARVSDELSARIERLLRRAAVAEGSEMAAPMQAGKQQERRRQPRGNDTRHRQSSPQDGDSRGRKPQHRRDDA